MRLAKILTIVGLLFVPSPAAALGNCGPVDEMKRWLWETYRERAVETGIITGGSLAQLHISAGGATWTILAVTPEGWCCIVAAGTAWFDGPGRE